MVLVEKVKKIACDTVVSKVLFYKIRQTKFMCNFTSLCLLWWPRPGVTPLGGRGDQEPKTSSDFKVNFETLSQKKNKTKQKTNVLLNFYVFLFTKAFKRTPEKLSNMGTVALIFYIV